MPNARSLRRRCGFAPLLVLPLLVLPAHRAAGQDGVPLSDRALSFEPVVPPGTPARAESSGAVMSAPVEVSGPLIGPALPPGPALDAARPLGPTGPVAADDSAASETWMPAWADPRTSPMMRTVGALVLVLGLAWVCFAIMRRMGGPLAGARRPSGVMQVLARYPVGRGQSVMLLQVGRRVLCVHQASGVMRTLADIHDHDEVAQLLARVDGGERGSFGSALRSAATGFERAMGRSTGAMLGGPSERDAPTTRPRRATGRPQAAVNPAMVETIDLTRGRTALARFLAGGAAR